MGHRSLALGRLLQFLESLPPSGEGAGQRSPAEREGEGGRAEGRPGCCFSTSEGSPAGRSSRAARLAKAGFSGDERGSGRGRPREASQAAQRERARAVQGLRPEEINQDPLLPDGRPGACLPVARPVPPA